MYQAYITKIKNVRKHSNADRLNIGECFGNKVIVGLDIKENDLGIYFPTDGQLDIEFLKANNLIGHNDPVTGKRIGGYFSEKGRITTQKLRGEISDGYFCPVDYLSYTKVKIKDLNEGYNFSVINGKEICRKYIVKRKISHVTNNKKNRKINKPSCPIFHEHIDTDQFKYHKEKIKEGDNIVITSKVHGTSGRTSNTIVKQYSKIGHLINDIFKREVIKPRTKWEYIFGTRKVIKYNNKGTNAFYEDETFRHKAHEKFIDKLHKGETVYYEIVGWETVDRTIMPIVNNDKLGKDFVKKYSKETIFHYGCQPGVSEVYVYRMTLTNEDGFEIDYDFDTMKWRCEQMNINTVQLLDKFTFNGDYEALVNHVDNLTEETEFDPIGKVHIQEGIVIRKDGSKWLALKNKSYAFKVLEGIIKDNGITDKEEEQELSV